jgi:serine/threonine protein kinase
LFGQSNIIVDGGGCPRLCDYGLASIIDPSEFISVKTAGPCRWSAPEIMNPPDTISLDALFTTESNVYAFGMTVLEVIIDFWPLDIEMLINTNLCRYSQDKSHSTRRGMIAPLYSPSLTGVVLNSHRVWMSGKTFGSLFVIVGMKSPVGGLHPG